VNKTKVVKLETNVIYNEDCLIGMKKLPDNSIDLVLTDPLIL
jgi:DNA modification methylase